MMRWGKGGKSAPEAASEEQSPPAASAASSAPAPAPATAGALDLATLLMREGRVTQEQLDAALAEQQKSGEFLGEILVDQGVIDEHSFLSVLAKYCKIPHLSLLDYLIDQDVLALVPKEVCLKYRLIPIDKLGKNLTVAMVNPLDAEALRQVRAHCSELRIKPILCAFKHFETVMAKVFNEKSSGSKSEMSASSFGITLTAEEKARVASLREEQATPPPPPPPAPEPEPIPEPEPDPEPAPPPPPPEPTPEPEPAPETEVAQASAPKLDSDSVFDTIFGGSAEEEEASAPEAEVAAETAPTPEPAPAAAADVSGSSVMQEMASVMMDSMRDTYAILARRMALFRDVNPEDVARIFSQGMTREFEENDAIFQKGDAGDYLYVILGGEVIIHDGDREIARLTRGGMFGEMALLSQEPRSASATAAESSSLLALDNESIKNVMPKEVAVQVLVNIVVTMSERLRLANAD